MPSWTDDGFVISARLHGESNAVIGLFTAQHGRHMGLVHGGISKSKKALIETGNFVSATWQARLDEQLGTYQLELNRSYGASMLDDPVKLAALGSVCALLEQALPEREPQEAIFAATSALFEVFYLSSDIEQWLPVYLRWELGMLEALGFGLELSRCAVSGETGRLAFVSPRTGHAVQEIHAGPYKERLIALPKCLGGEAALEDELAKGLHLTGHFLQKQIFALVHKDLPDARIRLAYLVGSRYKKTVDDSD
ncbi:MAG: DNA repair protein RecO [Candidatus Puniceispirillaceae bacterium]